MKPRKSRAFQRAPVSRRSSISHQASVSHQGAASQKAETAAHANFVIGPHALEALLQSAPQRIHEVLLAIDDQRLAHAARSKGVAVVKSTRDHISAIAGTESHQGVLCFVRPRGFETLDQLVARIDADPHKPALVVMLDSINDPHNLGACLRACECFGVDGVVFSKNRGAPLSPVVSKTSVGASELVPLIQVSNLAQAQLSLASIGFQSVATAVDTRAQSLANFEFPARTLLILGAEGPGVQPLLQKKSEHLLYIPMFGMIDSLNVSQALAVTLSWARG